ncbi:MAG: MBL fold metallo-hydrolase [Burkholderiales bacterium]|nr:MBL fold metallo-hydrolase [Burkholderiales bacterium]
MRVHHLNCGSMCPLGRRLLMGEGGWTAPARLCCHCLLIEGSQGLILVDTGLGTRDVARPGTLGGLFNGLARPRLQMSETALHQIRELGFDPRDVRHIVPTHLDLDHAGGIADFPAAHVHVYATELRAAQARATLNERLRYVPRQWAHGPRWVSHDLKGDKWFGMEAVRALPDTEDEVLLVPLVGHTRGHCGVAVRTDEGWLLHCGDAYFYRGEVDQEPTCPVGLRFLQWMLAMDNPKRLANQRRLRKLKDLFGDEVTLTSAHDPVELSMLASAASYRAQHPAEGFNTLYETAA